MLYITKKYSISITTQTKSKVKVFMNTVVGEFECDAVLDWSLDNDTLGLVTSDAILLYNIPTKNMKTMQGNFTNIFIEKNFYKIGNGYLQNEKKKIAKARPGLLRVFNQKAAIASNQIEIIDVKTKEKIILPGHATQIHQLLFKKYLFSAAVEDRFITRWELDGTSTSYIVDSCPVQIDANDSHLIALCEDGRVAIWDIEYPGEPQGYIELNRDNEPFISAALDGVYCLVAYGNELAPEFEKVLFLDENQNVLSQLVLTRVDSAKKLKKKQGRVVDSMVVEKKIVEEPSIEDQLKEQIVLTNQTEKKMTMTTLTAMLTQALISSDVEMLEKALWTSDKKVIYATIQRLNVVHVIPLLDELVIRIQKRPTRTHLLVEWLRGCLLIHQGYLVSVPHLTYKLGSLYKSLVNRVDVLNKLSRLNGRLDIITMNVIGEDVDEFVFEDGESQDSDAFDDEEDQLE